MLQTLRSSLLPLASVEREAIVFGGKCDLRALGEVEHVSLRRMHLLASLVGDVEVTLKDNLPTIS